MQKVEVERKHRLVRWSWNNYVIQLEENVLTDKNDMVKDVLSIIEEFTTYAYILEITRLLKMKEINGFPIFHVYKYVVKELSFNGTKKKLYTKIEIKKRFQALDWPFNENVLDKNVREKGVLNTIKEIKDYIKELTEVSITI